MGTQLSNLPFVRWALRHPRLTSWIILALGMVILLVIEARDVGLLPGQWIALIVATTLVAGACIWIISWEDSDDVVATGEVEKAKTEPSAASETTPPAAETPANN
jgi:protein-S-isoprenylcysteine O-methyltransferase Ste14